LSRLSLIVAGLLLAFIPASAGAASYPTGFQERTVADGFTRPVAVAWGPSGHAYVAEQDGRVQVVPPGGGTPQVLLDIRDHVHSGGDRGLLGIAVDSDFDAHPYLYLLYTYELAPLTPDQWDLQMVSRLTRVELAGPDALANPGEPEQTLLGEYVDGPCPAPATNDLDCMPADVDTHTIGTVRSAPDGTLWVGNGDGADFNTVDPRAFRALDEQSLAGKIFHVDRDGHGIPGHAFCPGNSDLDDVCTKVFARGFRNPFRFSLRPGGGLTLGDVGWDQKEEVDILLPGHAGRSYGWPCYEGTIRTPGYQDRPECAAEYAKPPGTHTPPDHDYWHRRVTEFGDAVMGGPTYGSGTYPAEYHSDVFIGDYGGGWIKTLEPAGGGGYTLEPFASDWFNTSLDIAPGGDLAFVEYGDPLQPGTGALKQLVYSPANRAPVAVAAADPMFGPAPLNVDFDAGGSYDDDLDPLTYEWDFGDGGPVATGAAASHTYAAGGPYLATLTVRDDEGAFDTDTVLISPDNTPPEISILSPTPDFRWRGGEPIQLSGTATDAEDDPAALDVSWIVVLHHGGHTHAANALPGLERELPADSSHDADSYYEVALRAEDSGGLATTETVRIDPDTTELNIRSEPPGAPVTWGGLSLVAPLLQQTTIGYTTSVSAAESFVSGGTTWIFQGWSDGGARLHDVTVPEAGLDITATYGTTVPSGGGGSGGGGSGGGGAPGASPPDGPAAPAADARGPRLRFDARRGFSPRRGVLKGVAEDASGVARVDVKLARLRNVAARASARWLRARIVSRSGPRVRWRLALGRRLPAGRYRLIVRARDRAGNVSRLRTTLRS
jgi:glucose/arabinose dehydrogenase/PKD repeat protein